jgi:hypothetical protein
MVRERRLGLVATVAFAFTVALAGQASAAVTPSLSALTTEEDSTVVYRQPQASDAPAKIQFYVPSGFTAVLAQQEGEVIGTATGRAAVDGGSAANLSGTMTAALATTTTTFGGVTAPLSTLGTTCTGTATHAGFWLINFTVNGTAFPVPAYVDDITLADPLSDFANNRVTVCLPSPNLPAGNAARAPVGARVFQLSLVPGVFSAPPGAYVWHAVTTPYGAGATLNTAASVESQSTDRTPQELVIKAKAVKGKHKVATVSGVLTAGGKGVSGGTVKVMIGKKTIGSLKTKAGGKFSGTVKLPTRNATLVAQGVVATKSAGSCSALTAGMACQGRSNAGFTVASDNKVRVKT